MDYETRAALSYYEKLSVLDDNIFIVKHRENGRVFLEKILEVYCLEVYRQLKADPIPGMPVIEELFEDGDRLIVIEEYISGETLAAKLSVSGTIPELETLRYMDELCSILKRLHTLEPPIIHRDIKPENIMVCTDQTVRLLDMNAAKYQNSEKDRDTVLLGTQGYAAPEQYGFSASDVRTDIYAVGRVLNTLLTGAVEGPVYEEEPIKKILQKATAFSPAERYQSIEELQKALWEVIDLREARLFLNGFEGRASRTEVTEEKTEEKTEERREGYPSALQPEKHAEEAVDQGVKAYLQNSRLHPEQSFLPPGFRTMRWYRMLIAVTGYLSIFQVTSTYNYENSSAAGLLINRVIYFLTLMACVLTTWNYRGLRKYMFFQKREEHFFRTLGVVLGDCLIFSAGVFLMILVEMIL